MTKPQTPMQAIQVIGKRITGEDISEERASWVLWEQTGWPSFWDDEPMKCIRRDARAFFKYGNGCARCGKRPTETFVCEECAIAMEAEETLPPEPPLQEPPRRRGSADGRCRVEYGLASVFPSKYSRGA